VTQSLNAPLPSRTDDRNVLAVIAARPKRTPDITGQSIGFRTVLSFAGSDPVGAFWNVRCVCGKTSVIRGATLRKSTSCGCKRGGLSGDRNGRYRHGHGVGRPSPTYKTWLGVVRRCTVPASSGYANYGGRGIRVCDSWAASFDAFLADMGERPAGKTLDRIDNDGNYEPGNCRWATRVEQASNTKKNVFVEFRGERMTVSELARRHGMRPGSLRGRLLLGWDIERAVSEEVSRFPVTQPRRDALARRPQSVAARDVAAARLQSLLGPQLRDVIVEPPPAPVATLAADLGASLKAHPQRILCPACGDLGKRDVVHDRFCTDCVSYARDQHAEDPSPESQERDEDGEIQCYVEALEDILNGWVPGKAPESRSALGLGKGAAR